MSMNAKPKAMARRDLRAARILGRGFFQVLLVAANTFQIAHGHLVGAAAVGFCISAYWWTNARASGRNDDVPYAAVWYGLGAALGTATGLAATSWWYGG
jgi:hypothetical protein